MATCDACKGNGICSVCDGTGESVESDLDDGGMDLCPTCLGSGKCADCDGLGEV